jgi:hypothetical protein
MHRRINSSGVLETSPVCRFSTVPDFLGALAGAADADAATVFGRQARTLGLHQQWLGTLLS